MSSFQSTHKFFIAFIAICITQFAFTLSEKLTTVVCTESFGTLTLESNAKCGQKLGDNTEKYWKCLTANCQKDNHKWVSMSGCRLIGGPPGTSVQQCVRYAIVPSGDNFQCWNSGATNRYLCPLSNAAFITCTQCVESNGLG
ncbi:uncharacterized protein MELLADRAFT_123817 [Melampsora larici-populina 98AG31]|uniref:Secreted protein n=1 Tax=Melampsora larici-populina (strain 98AG31 / pathotype 3-4-7) TaxID=747676 RepID=F4RQ45_MELLP|nr:uncharacterized protein MELLADRAFT_123817 [Melampsora larici-populina 98AG31]EGG05474.1 secreted protein [Melampsora larici-populina 98AG31]